MICEQVSSTHNKTKINVNGFLMVKNRNRGNLYYWCCEKRKSLNCKGWANTELIEGQHFLRSTIDHSHAAEASRIDVVKSINAIKRKAQETNDQPVQIIQDMEMFQLFLSNCIPFKDMLEEVRIQEFYPLFTY